MSALLCSIKPEHLQRCFQCDGYFACKWIFKRTGSGVCGRGREFSNHPIAKSILAAYGKEIDQSVISDYKEISGYGISVMAGEKKVFAGNTKLMDTECIEYTTCENAGTKVYLAVDGQYAGCILITDEVKPDSKKQFLT